MLGAEAFYEEYIEKPIITFISHRFEELCRSYFSLCVKAGKMRGVTNIGTFYYDDSSTHTNGEFDVVLERRGTYDIYEVKYYASPLSLSEMEHEARQIRNIKGLVLGDIGFISVSGYECDETPFVQIRGEDLYG